jgi:ribosomal protein S18 acetylase RimI-like enzyme
MIERATLADLDALVDLWSSLATDQRAYGSHLRGADSEPAVRRTLGEKVVDGLAFLAREDEPVGFVTAGIEEDGFERDARRGTVENVYVVPDRQGRGIGSALLERAETALARRDADVVTLVVLAGNERARSFYRDLGYETHRVELEKRL